MYAEKTIQYNEYAQKIVKHDNMTKMSNFYTSWTIDVGANNLKVYRKQDNCQNFCSNACCKLIILQFKTPRLGTGFLPRYLHNLHNNLGTMVLIQTLTKRNQ